MGVATMRGSAFQDTFTFAQSGGNITLTNTDSSRTYWDHDLGTPAFTGDVISVATPSGTINVVGDGDDLITVAAVDTNGANFNLSGTTTFTGNVFTDGGDINVDKDKSTITVNSGVVLSTRTTGGGGHGSVRCWNRHS